MEPDWQEIGERIGGPPADQRAAARHDEAMRMQALAIGVRMAVRASPVIHGEVGGKEFALEAARWAYREATGREW